MEAGDLQGFRLELTEARSSRSLTARFPYLPDSPHASQKQV